MAQYATTTINSAAPVVDVMTWMDTQMTSNGWTFVETWTSSTKVGNVYKSPAASNSVGVDFYVALYRSGTTSGLTFLLFEDWDAVNKKARKYAPVDGTARTVNPADNTVTDETGVLLDSAALQRQVVPFFVASLDQIIVTDITVDRVIFANRSYADSFAYAGVFDSLLPAAMDPVPLMVWNGKGTSSGTQSQNFGSTTREPTAPPAATYNFTIGANYPNTTDRNYAYGTVNGGTVSATTKILSTAGDLYRGGASSARVFVVSQRVGVNSITNQTCARGIAQGIVTSWSGGVRGDTLTETRDDASTRSYILVQTQGSGICHIFIRTA
jgi:hypothetical protein